MRMISGFYTTTLLGTVNQLRKGDMALFTQKTKKEATAQ